jgi:hypothetical protein
MNLERFKNEVEDFVKIYCDEYIIYKSIRFDDDFEATVDVTDCYENNYEIRIKPSSFGEKIVIDCDHGVALNANSAGFYCYLWHMTMRRFQNKGR